MEQPGLDNRHRDKDGRIALNTGIRSFARFVKYGPGFAKGEDDYATLSVVLHSLDEPSLSKLIADTK